MIFGPISVLLICYFSSLYEVDALTEHVDPRTGATWVAWDKHESLRSNKHRRHFCALRESPEERAKRPTVHHTIPENLVLPESFDARDQWPHCASIREIRDQSSCGSCWAFGAVEAMTDRLCIHSHGNFTTDLSATDLLSCCSVCGFGCEGGFPPKAWDFWKSDGIVTGGSKEEPVGCRSYPFPKCTHHGKGKRKKCPEELFETPKCVKHCDNSTMDFEKSKTKANDSYIVAADEQTIMMEIMKNGPVEASFDVYEDFLNYKKGIYFHSYGDLAGGHAVRLLGWGEEKGIKYWLLANSWNEDWGENGYFRILRGKNECTIESEIAAGLPDIESLQTH